MQATTVTHVRHLNEQGYNFSIKTTGISSHAYCPLEKKGVWLLSVSFLSSEDLFYHQHARVWFFLPDQYQKNRLDDKHLVQTKPKGEIP